MLERFYVRRGAAFLALMGLAVLAGCGPTLVTIRSSAARVPVLLGPIERIGDRESRRSRRIDLAPIRGKVSFQATFAQSNTTEVRGSSVYNVRRTASETRTQGDLHSRIAEALATTSGQQGIVVYLDDLRPYGYSHVGLGWSISGWGVEAKGSVTKPAPEER